MVVYQDNSVYYGDKEVATAEVYYDQADTIATSLPEDADAEKVEWMSLGVFAIAESDIGDTKMMMQLAVSKEGIIAGTYHNQITGKSRPLEGMVDQKTQRAAWKFADDTSPQTVFEAGIYNFTKDESTFLVHFSSQKTQTWTMVRLPPPDPEKEEG